MRTDIYMDSLQRAILENLCLLGFPALYLYIHFLVYVNVRRKADVRRMMDTFGDTCVGGFGIQGLCRPMTMAMPSNARVLHVA